MLIHLCHLDVHEKNIILLERLGFRSELEDYVSNTVYCTVKPLQPGVMESSSSLRYVGRPPE